MFEEISPSELDRSCRAGELWQILDVRETWEHNIAAINGSMHIPMGELPSRLAELQLDKPVAVLCHSGVRSAHVAGFLAGRGFERVANVTGGIDAWSAEVDPSLPRY